LHVWMYLLYLSEKLVILWTMVCLVLFVCFQRHCFGFGEGMEMHIWIQLPVPKSNSICHLPSIHFLPLHLRVCSLFQAASLSNNIGSLFMKIITSANLL
jgi:hypothetical protein